MKKTIEQLKNSQYAFETVSAVVLIVYGVWLINPYVDTFVRFPTLYQPMATIMGEVYWGVIYLLIGIFSIAVIRFDGLNLRPVSAFLASLGFWSMSVLFFFGDMQSQGWAVYSVFAIFNLLNFFGLIKEAGWFNQTHRK